MASTPKPLVEIAFADPPFTASPTWTDVTTYVREFTVDRARDEVNGRFLASRARVVLDNRDRRFEPFYAAGAHHPNVKRRRGIRIVKPGYALDLPGTSGHYASTPDAAALDITGDIDLRLKVAMDDWTPAASQTFVAKWQSTTQQAYLFGMQASGAPRFLISTTGANSLTAAATTSTGFTDGSVHWMRATWRQSDGRTQFFTSDDGTTWVQLGANVTLSAGSSIFDASAVLAVGAINGGTTQPLAGLVYSAEVRNGIDGTVVASPDFDQVPGTTSFTDSSGLVWTVNGASSAFVRATSVDTPVWRGFVDRIDLSYPQGLDAIAVLDCTDLLGVLATIDLEVPYVREVLLDSPRAYWRLQETSAEGDWAADSSGNGLDALYASSGHTRSVGDPITDDVNGAISMDGTSYLAQMTGTGVPSQSAFTLELWFNTTASGTPRAFLSTRESNGVWYMTTSGGLGFVADTGGTFTGSGYNDGAWHLLHTTYDGTNMRMYVDTTLVLGPTAATWSAGAFSFVRLGGEPSASVSPWSGSLDEVAIYNSVLSGTRMTQHYNARNGLLNEVSNQRVSEVALYVGLPDGLVDADDQGLSTLTGAGNWGSLKALEALRDVEVTEAGAVYVSREGKLTFRPRDAAWGSAVATAYSGSGSGGVEFTGLALADPTSDLANEVTNSRRNGTVHVASDSASITAHGPLSLPLSTISNSPSEAQHRAEYELARRADPDALRLEAVTFVVTDDNADDVLGRELWDRVSVTWSPPGGGAALAQEGLIVGVNHTYRPGTWSVGLALSALEARKYWVLGTAGWSELGTTTRLGF